jgi:hypothetical protein
MNTSYWHALHVAMMHFMLPFHFTFTCTTRIYDCLIFLNRRTKKASKEFSLRGLGKAFLQVFHFQSFIISESATDLHDRARAQLGIRCCMADCLMVAANSNLSVAIDQLISCFDEVNGMGRKQKKEYLRYFSHLCLKVI